MWRLTLTLLVCFGIGWSAKLLADPATTAPATRPVADINSEWQVLSQQLRGIMPSPLAVADPDRRSEIAPVAIPLLRRAISLNGELYRASLEAQPEARRRHYQYLSILMMFDDKAAIEELNAARQSDAPSVAQDARKAWFLSRWWTSNGDDNLVTAMLDELEQLARHAPNDDAIASILLSLQQEGSATPEQEARITGIITKHLRGPLAAAAVEQFKAAAKRASLIGKPLLISGTTIDGKAFSTQSLNGKAVVVHFGATWCGPWEAEYNRMLQTQWPADVAVVTVLCDEDEPAMRLFWEQRRPPAWPVLWSKEDPAGFASQYGVEQFPTTILIGSSGQVLATDIDPDAAIIKAVIAVSPPATVK